MKNKNQDDRILLSNLCYDLTRLSFEYDTASEELINIFDITSDDYLDKKWLLELASAETIENLKIFRDEWLKLLQSKPYACIGVFMQIDEDWKEVVNKSLKMLIKSVRSDLIRLKWDVSELDLLEIPVTELNKGELLRIAGHIVSLAIKVDNTMNPFYKLTGYNKR